MLPRVLDRKRAVVLARLVVNGLVQAIAGVGLAVLIDGLISVPPADGAGQSLLVLCGLGLGVVALRIWQRRDSEAFGARYIHDVRTRVLRHALRLDGAVRAPALGPMLTRLTNDLLAIRNWLSYGIADAAVASVTLACVLTYVAMQFPLLALAASTAAVMLLALAVGLAHPLDRRVRQVRRQRGRMAKSAAEKLLASRTIMAMHRNRSEVRRLSSMSDRLTEQLISRALVSGAVRYSCAIALPLALVLHWMMTGSVAPIATHQDPGGIAWLLMLGVAMGHLQDVTRAIDYYVNYRPAVERISRILALPVIVDTADSDLQASSPIAFEAIHIVSGLEHVTICRGERIVLTGGTQKRRERLINILARLEKASDVEVRIDGRDLQDLPIRTSRRLVRVVASALPLLPGTIGGNLRKAGLSDPEGVRERRILDVCGLPRDASALAGLLSTRVVHGRIEQSPYMDARIKLCMVMLSRARLLIIHNRLITDDARLLADVSDWAREQDVTIVISVDSDRDFSTDEWRTCRIADDRHAMAV